jgi:hypothetical protein
MLHAWERHLTSVLDGEVVPGNAVDAMLTALRSAGYTVTKEPQAGGPQEPER